MINNKLQKNNGFTLIELMVATTLFTIIMLMGIGSLIVSSNGAKAAQRIRTAVDNVNFAMESMSRELRTGTYFYCGNSIDLTQTTAVSDCTTATGGGDVIGFTPQQLAGAADRVAYELVPRGDGTLGLKRYEYKNSTTVSFDMVSSDVNINMLKFYVRGAYLGDNTQPSAEILIKGDVTIGGTTTPFYLETMSSERSSEK